MRRIWAVSCVLSVSLLVVQLLSLWQFARHSASRGTQVVLGQGCLRMWLGKAGDFPASFPGYSFGGWTGDALMWKPEFSPRAKLWVIPPAAPGAATPMAKQITGLCVVVPVYVPLVLALGTAGGSGWVVRNRRRAAPVEGRCAACGYDVRGLGLCPECGAGVGRVVARWVRRTLGLGGRQNPAAVRCSRSAQCALLARTPAP